VWDAIKEFGSKVADRPAIFLMIAGVFFLALGIAKGVTYQGWFPLNDDVGRFSAIAVGLALILWGGLEARRKPAPPIDVAKYGIKISSPLPRQDVDLRVTVTGTIKGSLPDGYKLMVLRMYPDQEDAFHPLREATINPDKTTWYAADCDMGGKAGDTRAIGAYLIGKSGQTFLRYYSDAAGVHYQLKGLHEKHQQEPFRYLPLIRERTNDMVECDRVPVKRR
jgi:hypothetical protein